MHLTWSFGYGLPKYIFFSPHIYGIFMMTTKHGSYQFINSRRTKQKQWRKNLYAMFFFICYACYKHKNDNGYCLKAYT